MKNLTLFASILTVVTISAAAADAAGTLDQQALPFGGNLSEGFEWQQQVTSGLTGLLTGITLYGSGTDLTVRIATGGAFNTGPYAFTGTAHLAAGGTFIDVSSANIQLTAGQPFVIDTLNGSNGNISVAAAPYSGGHLFLNFGAPGDLTACCGVAAMAFQTFVETSGGGAVPEPATWSMMILGFGGAGAALRRKGREVVAA